MPVEEALTVVELVSGPTGAVVLLLLILISLAYGSWKLLTEHAIPGIKVWLNKQDERFEKIMKSHEDDRTVFSDSIAMLADKIQKTDVKVDVLVDDVEELRKDVKSCIPVIKIDNKV